jgi:hypothetical protein
MCQGFAGAARVIRAGSNGTLVPVSLIAHKLDVGPEDRREAALLGLRRQAGHDLPRLDNWMAQRAMMQPSSGGRHGSQEAVMATEKKHGNREAKKPKKPVLKTIAAAPSTKDMVGAAVKAANKK